MMRAKHEKGTHVRQGALAVAIAALAAMGSVAVQPSAATAQVQYAVVPPGRYVLCGTVASSAPYRVLIEQHGRTVAVDLKHGTVIQPVGTSITAGMHLAIRGYWSKGVFIANHVMLEA
jgi:hypothetical protein